MINARETSFKIRQVVQQVMKLGQWRAMRGEQLLDGVQALFNGTVGYTGCKTMAQLSNAEHNLHLHQQHFVYHEADLQQIFNFYSGVLFWWVLSISLLRISDSYTTRVDMWVELVYNFH